MQASLGLRCWTRTSAPAWPPCKRTRLLQHHMTIAARPVYTQLRAELVDSESSVQMNPQEPLAATAADPYKRRQQRRLRRRAQQEQQEQINNGNDEEEDAEGVDEDDEDAELSPARRTRRSRVRSRVAARRRIPAPLTVDSSTADSYGARIGLGSDDDDGDGFNDLDDLVLESEEQQQQDVLEVDETDEDEEELQEGADNDEGAGEQRVPFSVLNIAKIMRDREQKQQQEKEREKPDPLKLWESNSMYVPVLTDEDLAADPPGHRSGYVAVIGRPNAGERLGIGGGGGVKNSCWGYHSAPLLLGKRGFSGCPLPCNSWYATL